MTTEERLLNLVLEEMKRLRDSHEHLATEVRKEFKELRQQMHDETIRSSNEMTALKVKMAIIAAAIGAVAAGAVQWAISFFR